MNLPIDTNRGQSNNTESTNCTVNAFKIIWVISIQPGPLQLLLWPQHKKRVTQTLIHTLQVEIILFKWEVSTNQWFLNRRDLFSLTFNLWQNQSCCRIKWSLIQVDTIIKRHCDPRLRSDFEGDGVQCFSCAHKSEFLSVTSQVGNNVFIRFFVIHLSSY